VSHIYLPLTNKGGSEKNEMATDPDRQNMPITSIRNRGQASLIPGKFLYEIKRTLAQWIDHFPPIPQNECGT
jgi:hypothetical protein